MRKTENSIFVITGQEEENLCLYDYANTGMPEFSKFEKKEYRCLKVYFRNEEDLQEFASKIDQKISKKTKWIWHPKLDLRANSLLRYVDDSD